MIRKKTRFEILSIPDSFSLFFGLIIKLPNLEDFAAENIWFWSDIIGDDIEQTIINYKNKMYQTIVNKDLTNILLVTYDSTSITIDYPADNSWVGYGDSGTYDNQYLVAYFPDRFVKSYYSQAVNEVVSVSTIEYVTETPETPIELGVIGLENDNYYIDNDIYLKVSASNTGVSNYLDVSVTDLQNQQSVNSRMYYFNNNTLTFDLSIMIKALMRKPQANFNYSELTPYAINTNYGRYKVQLTRYRTPENSNVVSADADIELNRTFIRGGVIDQAHNITAIENVPLRNCERLPVWQGYPTAEYRLVNGEILQYNDLTNVLKEFRPQPDCNAYYFKFKNKKGGYSYWMFNKSKFDTIANNVGYSDVYGEITDFGSNISRTNEVSGKIPYAFKGLAYDLLTSSETYLYEGDSKWTRVIQKSNKITDNTNKRVFDVTFKFDKIINYNPTI